MKLIDQVGCSRIVYHIDDSEFRHPFCSILGCDNNVFIADPFNNRIIEIEISTMNKKVIECKSIKGWFPRWIYTIDNEILLFLDSKNNTIGLLRDGKLIQSKQIESCRSVFSEKTDRNTYLVCGRGEKPIIELDHNFDEINFWLDSSYNIQSAQIFDDNILACDLNRSIVFVMNAQKEIIWSFSGEKESPLSTPKYAAYYDGYIYIADSGNSRILKVDYSSKKIDKVISENMWWPVCVKIIENYLLVTDAYCDSVYIMDCFNKIVWRWGFNGRYVFCFNKPRCIDIEEETGNLLISDTYNNRLVILDDQLEFISEYKSFDNERLFWPRCARFIDDKYILIGDSRNNRILLVSRDQHLYKKINYGMYKGEKVFFEDIHDLDFIFDLNKRMFILVCDALKNAIYLIDMEGNVLWIYNDNSSLKDPHQCRFCKNGNILISDTGNDRIIEVNMSSNYYKELKMVANIQLKKPRWVEYYQEDFLIVNDSDNNRIIITNWNGDLFDLFGKEFDLNDESVRSPRCSRLYKEEHLVVSDTYNNRIIMLSLRGCLKNNADDGFDGVVKE